MQWLKEIIYVGKCVYVSTSAILHVGLFAPNRPIGELCTNGKFGAVDLFKRFLNSSFWACAPNNAALGLNSFELENVRKKKEGERERQWLMLWFSM